MHYGYSLGTNPDTNPDSIFRLYLRMVRLKRVVVCTALAQTLTLTLTQTLTLSPGYSSRMCVVDVRPGI